MGQLQPYPPGGRRVARPAAAVPCSNCGELIGRGYPECAICAERIDELWWADWQALLAAEGIRPGTDEERELAVRVRSNSNSANSADNKASNRASNRANEYPWTCTDWALWLLRCTACGGRLGSGDLGCVACAAADQSRWAWDHQALPVTMTPNEHALRVTVAGLRAPHRHRDSVVAGWRLALPFLLTGQTPTTRQAGRIRALILAGRYPELARLNGFCAMASIPDLPWRTRS
jgi:hypothetical protein